MSLINQVLKDLDQRRGPAVGSHVAALQGVGLVNGSSSIWPRLALVFVLLLGLSFLGVYSYEYFSSQVTSAGVGALPKQQMPEQTLAAADPTAVHPVVSTPPSIKDPEPVEQDAQRSTGTPPESETVHSEHDRIDVVVTPLDKQTILPEAAPPPPATIENVAVKRMNPRQKAEQYFVTAQNLIDRGEVSRAEELLNLALVEYPPHGDARLALASLLLSQQRELPAEELLVTGLALNPRQGSLRRLYAQLLASRQALGAALQVLNQAGSDGRDGAETLGLRAAIHARLEQYDEAADDYRQALKMDSQRADWWTGFAIALEHLGRTGAATRAYQRALELPLQDSLKDFALHRLQVLQQHTQLKDG